MTLRIGFDVDGVLADLATAFRDVEARLFGVSTPVAAAAPEVEAEHEDDEARRPATAAAPVSESRRRRDAIWNEIRDTPDFWLTLRPIEPRVVRRIHDLMLRHHWEVFFLTQRPATVGQTVQRQTQKWLHGQGFDLPSVAAITDSRGAAAGALRLDFIVLDSPQHCLEVVSASRARPILIAPEPDDVTEQSAQGWQISVARSIGAALDMLEVAAAGAVRVS
jgi:hypothetical protein